MKLRIVQGPRRGPQCNPDFMNKIEANDLICPPSPPSTLLFSSYLLLFQGTIFVVESVAVVAEHDEDVHILVFLVVLL